MKNPFDPFGVFGEWKGQEPDDVYESWETTTLQEILSDSQEQIDNVITDAAWTGILKERQRCLDIIHNELKSWEDVDRVVQLIQGSENE
jgi:hypothetical protein